LKSLVEKFGSDDPELNAKIPVISNASQLAHMSNKDKLARAGQVDQLLESRFQRLATFEFSRDRKSMSVFVKKVADKPAFGGKKAGDTVLFVKGAPEQVIERCTKIRVGDKAIPFTDKARANILENVSPLH
jgi:Ca2+ transporting ATPase